MLTEQRERAISFFLGTWVALVCLSVTGVASDLDVLSPLKLELFSTLLLLGTAAWVVATSSRPVLLEPRFLAFWLPCCFFLVAIQVSELLNTNRLHILESSLWRHLLKSYLFLPLAIALLRDRRQRMAATVGFLAALTLLALWSFSLWKFGDRNLHASRLWLDARHGDPNFLSTYFGAGLFLLGYVFSHTSSRTLRWTYLIAMTLLISGLLATESRMGIAAAAIGATLIVLKQLPRLKAAIVLTCGGLFFIWFTFATAFSERIAVLADDSAMQRFDTIEAGIKAFMHNPFVGWGPGSAELFIHKFSQYPVFLSTTEPLALHNSWLQVLAELGILGFVAFVSIWIITLVSIYHARLFDPKGALYLFVAWLVCVLNMNALPLAFDDTAILFPIVLYMASQVNHEKQQILP